MNDKTRARCLAHLVQIATLANLEIVQERPNVEEIDVEVWVSLPSGELGALLARQNPFSGLVTYGVTGEDHEQEELIAVLRERRWRDALTSGIYRQDELWTGAAASV